jgi:hypothetical protein
MAMRHFPSIWRRGQPWGIKSTARLASRRSSGEHQSGHGRRRPDATLCRSHRQKCPSRLSSVREGERSGPSFERGRLVIANVAVQECRLGEFVRGGMTCRHEKAKDLLGKLIAKQGDHITCLGRGPCRSGGCDRTHDASAGGLPENACLCAHFVALPPSARDDHASRPGAYVSR